MSTTTVDLPSRVAFVNMKDGSVFYDCHPAEARYAIQVIDDAREKGEIKISFEELEQEIKYAIKLALTPREELSLDRTPIHEPDGSTREITEDERSVIHQTKTVITRGIHAHLLSDGMAELEKRDLRVTHIVMNAKSYAWLRKWDRDCLEIETKSWRMKCGVMANLWGAVIVVSRTCPENFLGLVAYEPGDKGGIEDSYRMELEMEEDDGYMKYGPYWRPILSDDMNVVEKMDIIMEHMKALRGEMKMVPQSKVKK